MQFGFCIWTLCPVMLLNAPGFLGRSAQVSMCSIKLPVNKTDTHLPFFFLLSLWLRSRIMWKWFGRADLALSPTFRGKAFSLHIQL